MASYFNVTFNHFLAIQRWATATGGSALLDMKDMSLEVKHRGRYYRMYPTFQALIDGRLAHLPTLTPDVRGFGGWRPYQTLTHPLSTDKQQFKAFIAKMGLRAPQSWEIESAPPSLDYIVKANSGSFGMGMSGPYRAGTWSHRDLEGPAVDKPAFIEQFVPGRMLKIWYWGRRAFFAHSHAYPCVVGDGQRTTEELLRERVHSAGLDWASLRDLPTAGACLAFQGFELTSVVPKGKSVWIDYRYGDRYSTRPGGTAVSDNQLEELKRIAGDQVEQMGAALVSLLRQTFPAPVVITADGILDEQGQIWWLEMNTNSLLPPEAYEVMFADLFG